jgi:hypothetical protein
MEEDRMNIKRSGLKALKYLQDIDRDDVMEALGIQERRSGWTTAFGSIGIFALGCLVGAGIGLAFAPKAGDELRNELGDKVRRKAQELQQQNEGAFGGPNRSQMPVT